MSSTATKPIRLSAHACEQLAYRGASEAEVAETIRAASWQSAELGRRECRKTFSYGGTWHGKPYQLKEVRPIFADEPEEIVVVTVYVYYR